MPRSGGEQTVAMVFAPTIHYARRRQLMSMLRKIGLSPVAAAGVAHAQQTPPRVAAKLTTVGEMRDSVCWEVAQSPVTPTLMACTSNKEDLRTYDLANHRSTVLVRKVYAGDIAWSPAGDRIAFYWQNDEPQNDGKNHYHIWTVAVDRSTGKAVGQARRVSMSEGSDPEFSPDGRTIVFQTPMTGGARPTRDLLTVPTEGGPERVLVTGAMCRCSWSGDGKWVYFVQLDSSAGGRALYRVSATGGKPERVLSRSAPSAFITSYSGLSRDGRSAAFWDSAGVASLT